MSDLDDDTATRPTAAPTPSGAPVAGGDGEPPGILAAPRPNHDGPTTHSPRDGLARRHGQVATAAHGSGPGSAADGTVVRSEERLDVRVENVVVGRARLVTYVVTEEQTFTLPVRRQEVRLVHDAVPEHDQVVVDTGPVEETYEVVLHAEQVVFTTRVVPVERVRMIKRVRTVDRTVSEPVSAERVDVEHTAVAPPAGRVGVRPQRGSLAGGREVP